MGWWIAGGVVVAAVAVLVAVTGALRREVAELRRVADLATERAERSRRRLLPTARRLEAALAALADHPAGGRARPTGSRGSRPRVP